MFRLGTFKYFSYKNREIFVSCTCYVPVPPSSINNHQRRRDGVALDEQTGAKELQTCRGHSDMGENIKRVEKSEESSGRVCMPPFLTMLIFLAGS